jgi:hypothetical protein
VRSDNGSSLELAEVRKAIDLSDVLVLGFLHLSSRLLFDVRTGPREAPLIRFVPPVRTPEERFAHLRGLRPGLNDPQKYVFIRWPLGLESLIASGVWQQITDHCVEAGGEAAERDCAVLLKRLCELDRREDLEAIAGKTYRTLWPGGREA